MNKKAVSGFIITGIIALVFFLIVAGIFFFSPNSLSRKIGEQTKGLEGLIPGKAEKEIPAGLNFPPEIIEIFEEFYKAFKSSKGKGECFVEYKSLNLGEYWIELEYLEAEKGTNMVLKNPKKQEFKDPYFVNDVKPCIALPDEDNNIAKVSSLDKVKIKKDNELHYGGNDYNLFSKYPILYKPKESELACFFTDDTVIDPEDGKTVYGSSGIWWWEGFDDNDMEERMKGGNKCVI